MKTSSNAQVSGINNDRLACFTVTGMNNSAYSRTADRVMHVPFSRMSEIMHLFHCMGATITHVQATGTDLPTAEGEDEALA